MAVRKRRWAVKGVERSAWVVNYSDTGGKRRLKTFNTKKEADAWAVTANHEVKHGIHTPASVSRTVEQAAESWIKNSDADGLELSTVKQRRVHLRVHIRPYIGLEKLSALTMPRVGQFLEDLRDNGRSVAMRRKVLTSFKAILKYAQSKGWVAQNVATGVKVKSDDRNTKGPLREGHDFPTKAELRTLMDKAPARWWPLVITAIFTGMRVSELRGLRWSDVDLAGATIHVRQRADNWGKLGKPKSRAGSRDIPLAPIVVNALKQWRTNCPLGRLALVFPNETGEVESYFTIRSDFWIPLQLENGISVDTGDVDREGKQTRKAKYPFHTLRHAAASLFIAHLGWTPKRLQVVMGHASIQQTFDRYGHLFADHDNDREAMKRLQTAVLAS
jgi:integrase